MTFNPDPQLMYAIYGSVLSPNSAVYCSAPISSGRRYQEWIRLSGLRIGDVDHATSEFNSQHKERVVLPNIAHAKAIVRQLRASISVPVIDPTAVPAISSWLQGDWIHFWEGVIARFACSALFIDDWQFSFGCSHEFMFCKQTGIATFDERGEFLSLDQGKSLVRASAQLIGESGGDASRIEKTLAELISLSPRMSESTDKSLWSFVEAS